MDRAASRTFHCPASRPRLLVTLVVVSVMGRWMIDYLMDFCVSIFQRAATLLG